MTWLFTQVWVWSLASFALGALITWLLFVRPLRKQLRDLPEPGQAEPPATRGEWDPEERTALDLLSPAEQDEEPAIGDWERTPRYTRSPEPPAVRVPARSPEWEIPEWAGPPDSDTREVTPLTGATDVEQPDRTEAGGAPDEPDPSRWANGSGPIAPAELDSRETGVESRLGSNSTWFQKPEVDDRDWTEDVAAREPQAEAPMSDRLQSLFEPLGTPDPDAARPDPIELGETQSIPRIAEPPDDADLTALPRRTPGAGPRPGAQNLKSVANRLAAEGQEEPEETGPADGYTIKGHFASRQYHTPESPQYERVVAEVWFRTPADAEQAGFESWDARGN